MHRLRYSSAALLAALFLACASSSDAQEPAPIVPAPGEATYVVFLGGQEIGREQVSVSRAAAGWTITSTGHLAAPLNLTNNSFSVTYGIDWQPVALRIEAQVQDRAMTLATSFAATTASSQITQDGVTTTRTDEVSERTVVLPNNFYAGYEALAVRLASLGAGAELPVYIAPEAEIRVTVRSVTPATYQTPGGTLATRRYAITFHNPNGPVDADVTVDERNRFARLDVADGVLSVARDDLAGVATRQETFRNPTDVDVRIPAAGFNLAGTVTTPAVQGRVRHPAVLLVAGSGPLDRDATVAGIPLFAQLAGQLAEQGHVVLRYDKRGVGQSGGRTETATLQEYAEDALAAVRFLSRRRDVDNRRIFVVGHSEGAAIAMLAGRERRISGLILMSGMGTVGKDLILEQQQYLLNLAKVEDSDRSDKVALQEKILQAAIDDAGWDALPAEVRPLVDTPWYRSLLMFDPAEVMPRVRGPVLVLHGALDREVLPHHADRLGELAKARRNAPAVEVKHLPGLNHLLVPAKTGHVSEYASLEAKAISPEVAKTISGWIATIAR